MESLAQVAWEMQKLHGLNPGIPCQKTLPVKVMGLEPMPKPMQQNLLKIGMRMQVLATRSCSAGALRTASKGQRGLEESGSCLFIPRLEGFFRAIIQWILRIHFCTCWQPDCWDWESCALHTSKSC